MCHPFMANGNGTVEDGLNMSFLYARESTFGLQASAHCPMNPESLPNLLKDAEAVLTPRRLRRLREVASRRLSGLTVAFDSLHDPHNISAALRSCEAFGVQHVRLVKSTTGAAMNRGVSKGCERWLSSHWHETAEGCVEALHRDGFRVLLAKPADDSVPLHSVDFAQKVALVFGNEHAGVSPEFDGMADGRVHIPMMGFVESFNVSVAVAICVSHASRARRLALGSETDMTPGERDALLAGWLKRELDARRGFRAAGRY